MTGRPLPRPETSRETLAADLAGWGYCLVDRALDPASIDAVHRRIEEQAAAERERGIAFENPGHRGNQWVNMLINKGDVFLPLIESPVCDALVGGILGPDFLLSCCDAQIKHPGAAGMPIHTDQWCMPDPVFGDHPGTPPGARRRTDGRLTESRPTTHRISPTVVVNVMWMVSDFTEDNGATRVVPRSHLSGGEPDASRTDAIDTVAATGPAGTALVFDGRLSHRAGRNDTDRTRYGITCAFCGPQFRPLENYTLGLRPEVKAAASPALLQRLGFRAWSTYGHTGDPALECSVAGSDAIGPLRHSGTKACPAPHTRGTFPRAHRHVAR